MTTKAALEIRSEVVTYDFAIDEAYPFAEFSHCDFLVVCVNTPSTPTGSADLTQVNAAFAQMPPHVPVVLRSTVPPGTTAELARRYEREVLFWPEYMGESSFAVQTMDQLRLRPFQIVGASKSTTSAAWLDLIAETYGPLVRLAQVTSTEAEVVKYMENCYFAVKVTFVNQFRQLCDTLGIDWHSVREGWLLDPRIERDHSDAFRKRPGYDGKCLPKDVAAIIAHATEVGVDLKLLSTVQEINNSLVNRKPPNGQPPNGSIKVLPDRLQT